MTDLELGFTGMESNLTATLFVAAAALAAFMGYLGFLRHWPRRRALLLITLRICAVCVVALLFLRPIIHGTRVDSDVARVAILLDTSRSMGFEDEARGTSRLAAAGRILFDPDRGLVHALEKSFTIDLFRFSENLETFQQDDLPSIVPDGDRTALGGALQEVSRRIPEDELAAVILLTDGRETVTESARAATKESPAIHAVGLGIPEGAPLALPDAAITRIAHDGKVLMGDRMVISITGRVTNLDRDQPLEVDLLVDNRPVATETVALPPADGEGFVVFDCSFSWIPRSSGLHELGAQVRAIPDERILENNRRSALVQVSTRRIEMLIYETRPRWEYKFLRRTLSKDPNLNLTSLVRTGPGHFLQQGDSPVDFSGGLPASLESLGKFDCILLGDVLAVDFAPGVAETIRRYVEKGVGGLILAGSRRSFGPGGLKGEAIEPALPVNIPSSPDVLTGRFSLRVTTAGAAHPLMRDMEGLLAQGNAAKGLESLFTAGSLKPGSQVLAVANAGNETWLPLLVVHRYGEGRAAAVLSESTWRWTFGTSSAEESGGLHARFWGRMARWASGRDVEESRSAGDGAIHLSRFHLAQGEHTTLEVEMPADKLECLVTDETGRTVPVPFKPDGDKAIATIVPESGGFHTIKVNEEGVALVDEVRFYVDRRHEETSKLTQDRDLLTFISRATGGAYHTPAEAGRIPSMVQLVQEKSQSLVQKSEWRLEDRPWAYLLVVALLGLEWLFRRRAGIV